MTDVFYIDPGETESPLMPVGYDVAAIDVTYYNGGGAEIQPTAQAKITASRTPAGDNFRALSPSGWSQWLLFGPCCRVKVDLAGTGAASARVTIWRSGEGAGAGAGIPPEAFAGLRAMTIQNYIEANVKNGVQFEVAAAPVTLANNASLNTIFVTGPKPVVIKNRVVKFNGSRLATRVYKNATFDAGTGTLATVFNLNDINPVASSVVVRANPTGLVDGVEFGAPTFDLGSTGVGNTSVSTYSAFGVERILAPNRVYQQKITNDSGADQLVTGYLTWYEGDTDLPFKVPVA